MKHSFDIIIVGGGHAGVEAALISVKKSCSVLMVTQDLKAIGRMSCNPAIGGLAKGQLVREIDVLGGQMGFLLICQEYNLRHSTSQKEGLFGPLVLK